MTARTIMLGFLTALGVLAAPVGASSGTLSIGPSESPLAPADTIAADGLAVPVEITPAAPDAPFAFDGAAASPAAPIPVESAPQTVASADGSAPIPAPQESGLVQALSFLLQRAGR